MKADWRASDRAGGLKVSPGPAAGWPTLALAGTVAAFFLFPLGYLIWGVASRGGDAAAALSGWAVWGPLLRSLFLSASVAVACGALGGVLAWLVVRTDVPGRRLWKMVLPLPLVIPSFVGATALLSAFGPGALVPFVPRPEGFWGAFAVLVLLSYPYVYLPTAARLRNTAPELEEAARVLDRGFGRMLRRVAYPQVRGTVRSGMLLVFLYALSDFGAVSLMRYDTITRAIFSARLLDQAASLTMGLILAALALAAAGGEWAISRSVQPVSRSGSRQIRYRLGGWRWPTGTAIGAVTAAGFAAPVTVFAVWTARGSATVGVGYSGWGDSLDFLISPLLNSAVAAATAAAAAAAITLPVAFAAARGRGFLPAVAAASVSSVFALPGLVVALAVVFWAIRAPSALSGLYQTFPLLTLAYVLNFGAQSMGASRNAVRDLPPALPEAAQTLGAGRNRRFWTVNLPLIAPGLISGAGLVMLSTLKELPATLLLAPIGFQTLSTLIWGAAQDGFFAEVGVASLSLIGLSWVLTWLLVLRRPPT